jgi:hypothetical protein
MRFKTNNFEIVLDDSGLGYAITGDNVTHHAYRQSKQHFMDENQLTEIGGAKILEISHEGSTYTLDPFEVPVRIDRFAGICQDSVAMMGHETFLKLYLDLPDFKETGVLGEAGGDIKWLGQELKRKHGKDAQLQTTDQKVVDDLKAIAREHGLSSNDPPSMPERK